MNSDSEVRQKGLWIIFLYIITYIILCVFVIVFPYEIHDSDSAAYSHIGQKLADIPIIKWCAPEWWGHADNQGLFQDHPPGILWITAIFARGGVPGTSAALCANFLYIFLSLYFIYRLASHFGGFVMGWGAVYGYIFTPIFLQYLIRANHEHPLNLAVLAGFYGFVRCEKSWKYKALFVIALIFAVFTKGMNAIVLTILALMYWLLFMRSSRSFLFLVAANFLTLGIIFFFEIWYQQVTNGVGFWQNYLSFQGGLALRAGFNPLRKIYNFIWYLGRAIWFPAPWVFFVFFGFYKSMKGKISLAENKFFKICLINATLIIFWFSLFDRKADRYIFSAYCFLALAGVWILLRLKPKFMNFFQKREKLLPIYLSIILIVLTLLRIYFHSYHYKFIRFWSG